MKKRNVFIKQTLGILFIACFSTSAFAETYTVREVRTRCRNQGENAVGLGLLGAAAGCALGYAVGGRGRDCGVGAAAGGAVGAVTGLAISCKDEVRYVTYWDSALDTKRPGSHFERWEREVSGRILREGYHRDHGYVCKEFETETYASGKIQRNKTVSCKVRGEWNHNYSQAVFVTEYKTKESKPRPSSRKDYSKDEDEDKDVEEEEDSEEEYVVRRRHHRRVPLVPYYGPSYHYQYQYQYGPGGYHYQYQYQYR